MPDDLAAALVELALTTAWDFASLAMLGWLLNNGRG